MAEKILKKWNVPFGLNGVLLGLLLLLVFTAILVSVLNLFVLPLFINQAADIKTIEQLPQSGQFSMALIGRDAGMANIGPADSPYVLNLSINTPRLGADDTLRVVAISGGKAVALTDCLEGVDSADYAGATNVNCEFQLPYDYLSAENVKLYGIYKNSQTNAKLGTAPMSLSMNWAAYETAFWGSSLILVIIALIGLVVVGLVGAAMLFFAGRIQHAVEYAGEYTIGSLFSPIEIVKQAMKNPRSIVSSPAFWGIQILGILVLVLYLFIAVSAWKSPSALFAFFISGVYAFIIPFILVAILWFADYKEREPLRVIVSLFLWGGLSCLLAIGFNSTADMFLSMVGLGAFTAFIVAPLVEETFKGTGLVIFSFHHEFDDMVDGIVYGFTIGMGFAFVENWLYFLNAAPLGGSTIGWVALFFLRSIIFAANHGVFTAFTGGVIGFLKQKRVSWAPYGFFIGVIPAIFLHAMHNSGAIWAGICGPIGAILQLLVLAPMFDYGALVLLMIALILGVYFSQRIETGTAEPKEAPKEEKKPPNAK